MNAHGHALPHYRWAIFLLMFTILLAACGGCNGYFAHPFLKKGKN